MPLSMVWIPDCPHANGGRRRRGAARSEKAGDRLFVGAAKVYVRFDGTFNVGMYVAVALPCYYTRLLFPAFKQLPFPLDDTKMSQL
jgi:hypothetical protein